MLALDLGVFHRRARAVGTREALLWSGVWVALALAFGAAIWRAWGSERGLEFLTGSLIEKSLSVDNLFVFAIVFGSLGIPALHRHRLFWGILSALVLLALMIFAGAAMLGRFHWLVYVFGAFLVVTGFRLFLESGREPHPERSWPMRLARREVPSTSRLDGERFFAVENGRRVATSIPAIFAITEDPFIVFTSNIFAILGLRSLYFLLAGLLDRFRYLKVGLAAVSSSSARSSWRSTS